MNNNKYRINTNWSLNGTRLIYDVIIDLANELDKSLKSPMMRQSKSDEEVRRILDNPEGITIEELQVIDVWSLPKELRLEVRERLDWAYRYLSVRLTQLIATRNAMTSRSPEKDRNIENKNKELKDTIVNQYNVIKEAVENYKGQENLDTNTSERKLLLLKYIQKVYSQALSEIIENLFSTAAEDTQRAKIFPLNEREKTLSNISNLKKEIRLLTRENKQKQLASSQEQISQLQQQNANLQQQLADKKELETKLVAFQTDLSSEQQAHQQVKDELEKVKKERNQRPNITLEKYDKLQNNQKPADYDDIKNELGKWKNGFRGKNLEQVQTDLNKIDGLKQENFELENKVNEEKESSRQKITDILANPLKELGINTGELKETLNHCLKLAEDKEEEFQELIEAATYDEERTSYEEQLNKLRLEIAGIKKQLINPLMGGEEKIIKKSLSEQSIQEDDKILIEKIAEEFAEERLQGKTVEIILEKLEGAYATTEWEGNLSGFKIKIDSSEGRGQIFRSLAHELAHAVIELKVKNDDWNDNSHSEGTKRLYFRQRHSNSFWKVFLDEDTISTPNDISTLKFVTNKLSEEDQNELNDFIKVENKKGKNESARWVYFPELHGENILLEGKVRKKKILKTKDQTEAKAEWDKIWRNVLQLVDDSMNTPADEARSNWANLFSYADKETRWVRIDVWQKKESEEESDQGKYKIYVFHNQNAPADLIKKLDEILINDEAGEWEETITIDLEKAMRLEDRKLPTTCEEKEEVEQTQAQILQSAKN